MESRYRHGVSISSACRVACARIFRRPVRCYPSKRVRTPSPGFNGQGQTAVTRDAGNEPEHQWADRDPRHWTSRCHTSAESCPLELCARVIEGDTHGIWFITVNAVTECSLQCPSWVTT